MAKGIKISMTGLIVLLVLALGYIGYSEYSDWKQAQDLSFYQQGAQLGYEQAIGQLYQSAVTCQQVPLTLNNQTINLVAVECLQQKSSVE